MRHWRERGRFGALLGAGFCFAGCVVESDPESVEDAEAAVLTTYIPSGIQEIDEQNLAGQIVLPIEVMPTDASYFFPSATEPKFDASRTFNLSASPDRATSQLVIVGHRLGYRDGHMVDDELVKAGKASVLLGEESSGCQWIPLVNQNQPPETQDEVYGGIGGGFRTVRLSLPLTRLPAQCLIAGDNTIRFRFNGSDGSSSGYRILYFNIVENGQSLVPDSSMAFIKPSSWAAPAGANATHGQALWQSRGILSTPSENGSHAITAACSDCHARDAADLAYYSYSNTSIINRAVFHGLSIEDGEDLAAYVRSHAAPRVGRPWNPPYQPGRYVDENGNPHDFDNVDDRTFWAAGAGLSAVLGSEADEEPNTSGGGTHNIMLDRLFGLQCSGGACTFGPTTHAMLADRIRGVGLAAETINLRRVPIAVQLPDWNAWLPEHHPLDMWGSDYWTDETFLLEPVRYNSGQFASKTVAGDFDGDHHLDLATYSQSSGYLTILHGDDDGRFEELDSTYVGVQPIGMTAADFDGDGDSDLVVSFHHSTIIKYFVSGRDAVTGDFTLEEHQQTLPYEAFGLAVGALDTDGRPDLVVTAWMNSKVMLMSSSTFPAAGFTQLTTVNVGSNPKEALVANLDGVGPDEIVVSNYGSHSLSVLKRVGLNIQTSTIQVSDQPWGMTARDLNGDSLPDVAVACGSANQVAVLLSSAAGLGAASYLSVSSPDQVVSGDFDANGTVDLAAVDQLSTGVTLFSGHGDGTFAASTTVPTSVTTTSLFAADFDVNGSVDLAVGAPTGIDVRLSTQRPELVYERTRANLTAWRAQYDSTTDAAARVLLAKKLPGLLSGIMRSAGSFIGTGMVPAFQDEGLPDGFRGTRGPVIDDAVFNGYEHELVKRNLAQWAAVKYWELMHEFDLEGMGTKLFKKPDGSTNGEALMWPMGGTYGVHPIAPHITSVNSNNFRSQDDIAGTPSDACGLDCPADMVHAKQTPLQGDYDSTVWYHLQLLLNGGGRNISPSNDDGATPWDIGYAYIHIDDVARATGLGNQAPFESLRYLATLAKAYQMRDNDTGPGQAGWSLRDVSPRLLFSNFEGDADKDDLMRRLDDFDPGLRVVMTDAFLQVFLDVVSDPQYLSASAGRYLQPERCGGQLAPTDLQTTLLACLREPTVRQTWWRLNPATYQVTLPSSIYNTVSHPAGTLERTAYLESSVGCQNLAAQGYPDACDDSELEFSGGYLEHADDIYRTVALLEDLHADPDLVCRLIDWGEYQWPGPGWTNTPNATGANNWSAWRTCSWAPAHGAAP
ncbi:MAG: VCBS repeat-containing protein [Polyangiaceae bacterium]